MTHLKTDKPQTKLGILNMAVEVIMTLEQQVRGITSTIYQITHLLYYNLNNSVWSFNVLKIENSSFLDISQKRRN